MADATFDETNEITDADAFSDAMDSTPDLPEEDSFRDCSPSVDNYGTPSDRDSPGSDGPLTDPVAGSDNEIVPQDAVGLPERPESTKGGCSMSGPVELSPWLLMIVLLLLARRRRPPICP
jgi:MYXO-CTERM domain-containing protein